jgi:beta-lactamase class A
MKKGVLLATIGIVAFAAGSVGYMSAVKENGVLSPTCSGKYSLIDSRFNCDEYSDSFSVLKALQSTLESNINHFKLNSDVSRASVWVRDLSTLQWVGVNEKDLYAPASLFKVPIMIAIYKYAEIQPDILDQKIAYTAAAAGNVADVLPETTRMKEGAEYSVEQVVEQMIKYSDNEAFAMLTQRLSTPFLTEVYGDLGIHLAQNQSGLDDLVTARSYANIFRILYQSSYLTPEYSQRALSILSETEYQQGVRTAVPKDVRVAHKFGIRKETNDQGVVLDIKLHDCGIVYVPSRPYLYCILTEGSDESRLSSVIASLSHNIYTAFQ